MIRISNSDIYILSSSAESIRLRLPIPPSVNKRKTIGYKKISNGGCVGFGYTKKPILINTIETREYKNNSFFIQQALRKVGHSPLENYSEFYFQFFLKNMRYDTHNGLKIICDILEEGGVIVNDKYILPQMKVPIYMPNDPKLIIEFPKGY